MLDLDASDPKEQAIADALIQCFDKDRFQKLLIEWVLDYKVSFCQPEQCRFWHVFEYLDPSVAVTNVHISHNTVRKRIVDRHLRYKEWVINHLKSKPNLIHIAVSGWRSRNRHAQYGHIGFYIGKTSKPVLGQAESAMLRPCTQFSGDGTIIWAQVGGFRGRDWWGACYWCCPAWNLAEEKDSVGKLHNVVHWIHRPDKLTYWLHLLQEEFFEHSENPKIQVKEPFDVVLDNLIRWLSTLYMMRRAPEV